MNMTEFEAIEQAIEARGIDEINAAKWEKDQHGCLNLFVHDRHGEQVHCWLSLRPNYCDRGHIQSKRKAEWRPMYSSSFGSARRAPRRQRSAS